VNDQRFRADAANPAIRGAVHTPSPARTLQSNYPLSRQHCTTERPAPTCCIGEDTACTAHRRRPLARTRTDGKEMGVPPDADQLVHSPPDACSLQRGVESSTLQRAGKGGGRHAGFPLPTAPTQLSAVSQPAASGGRLRLVLPRCRTGERWGRGCLRYVRCVELHLHSSTQPI